MLKKEKKILNLIDMYEQPPIGNSKQPVIRVIVGPSQDSDTWKKNFDMVLAEFVSQEISTVQLF